MEPMAAVGSTAAAEAPARGFLVDRSAPSTGNVDANEAATEDAINGGIKAGIIAVR
jgi:hypothetical protein